MLFGIPTMDQDGARLVSPITHRGENPTVNRVVWREGRLDAGTELEREVRIQLNLRRCFRWNEKVAPGEGRFNLEPLRWVCREFRERVRSGADGQPIDLFL